MRSRYVQFLNGNQINIDLSGNGGDGNSTAIWQWIILLVLYHLLMLAS
jgi:hypothetical protein